MADHPVKILIADDEKEIRDILTLLLRGGGYEVTAAKSGEEAVHLADRSIGMYILDINMPGMSGYETAVKIREKFYAPIIFLTAYSGESDKTMGFSAGADDYIVKPFSNTELLLRVRSLLRRAYDYSPAQGSSSSENKISYKDLVLDLDSQSVQKDGQTISLTWTEFQILELFISNRGRIYSLDHIYQSIWQEDAVGDGTIMVHIKNLRKKLGDNSRNPIYIKTAWGKGYYVD